jgi:DNA-binding NtrC family response regulator
MTSASIIHHRISSREATTAMNMTSTRRRILVIDHHDDIRGILCDRLSALGFDVAAEDNGMSGLSRVAYDWERAPFHGMLVELQMPVLGGMAVLQEMCDRYPTVSVIVMSDAKHIDKLRRTIKFGAKEYLVKPFDAELFQRKCMSVFLDGTEHRV